MCWDSSLPSVSYRIGPSSQLQGWSTALPLDRKAAYFKMSPGNISRQLGCLSTPIVCFRHILVLSLLLSVPYPAIRKQLPPKTSSVPGKEFEEQQHLPCSVTVWNHHHVHIHNLPCGQRQLPPFQPGVFPVCGGRATVYLGSKFVRSNHSPFFWGLLLEICTTLLIDVQRALG